MARCLRCGAEGRLAVPGAVGAELARLHEVSLPAAQCYPGAYAVEAWSRPARHIGGDLLAVRPLAGGRLAVFQGDVMGHGTPAAVVASGLRAALHLLRQGEA